MGLMGDQKVQR